PIKHTEASIKRARKANPPFPGTQTISTHNIPLKDRSTDLITLIMSAHEIRNQRERIVFFNELYRILKTEGKVVIIEHLRDFPNLLAYNIGFFHFHSKSTWLQCFYSSNFSIQNVFKITPFVSCFILKKNGNTT
ncbi:MAG TPA: methyltransferase domain-containing protein, partial [Saprospiraceae bacterium]|nr:methyltransferase domain-containing protein [Saprospiraceae bacterium]